MHMTAVVHHRFSPDPERALRLESAPRPVPTAGSVLVRVRAASIDSGTWHVMAGRPWLIRLAGFGLRRPRHLNPGRAFAGVIEAVGDGVTGLAPGQEVYGVAESSMAEYALAPAHKVAAMPAISFAAAATVPISGITALQAVRDQARVAAGDRVLVIGASGGVGSFAVQLAAIEGAHVTGVARASKLQAVRGLGAQEVIDYRSEEIDRDLPGHGRYDVVIDIAGNRPLSLLRRVLAPRGRLVIVGGEGGDRLTGGIDRGLRALALSPFLRQRLTTFVASENAEHLTPLTRLIETGRLVPPLDRALPVSATVAAMRALVAGTVVGKVALTVGEPEAEASTQQTAGTDTGKAGEAGEA